MDIKQKLINSFEILAKDEALRKDNHYVFKIRMYRKAAQAFKMESNEVITLDNAYKVLGKVFKNPTKIKNKTRELLETGKISAVEKAKDNPITKAIKILSSVPLVGPVKAKKLVNENKIMTVNDLKKRSELLTDKQKIGLKYYDELIDKETLEAVRIPRKEIEKFEKMIPRYNDVEFDICGSYRRKLETSGDIDVLFTGSKTSYKKIIQDLKTKGILKESLSDGVTKWMGFGKVEKLHRRIDIMYIKAEEYPFALMYFTGSKEFNESFRGYCRKKGYTLNEHRIESLDGKQIKNTFHKEEDIFKFVEVPYIKPENRNAGKFKLPVIKSSSIVTMMNDTTIKGPSLHIDCLKGKGMGGYSIQEIRDYATAKRINSSGTKKEICNRLFKQNDMSNNKNLINVSKGVLLAQEYKNNIDPSGYIASEKYDGIRAIWTGKYLKSRTNKIIHAPKWFTDKLPKNHALDGELFINRGAFERTTSIVAKKEPVNTEWRNIKFMIFDVPDIKEPFNKRIEQIENIVAKINRNAVKATKHYLLKNRNHMKEIYNDIVSKGGEGIMLRKATSMYEQKRSKDLLKVKPKYDAEAEILNMIEGKGKDKNSLGALKVKLLKNETKEFKIGTGFTKQLRNNIWKNKNKYIGDVVTFEYKGLTKYGIPRHPAFKRFRVNKNV